jgi:hypothetical protein
MLMQVQCQMPNLDKRGADGHLPPLHDRFQTLEADLIHAYFEQLSFQCQSQIQRLRRNANELPRRYEVRLLKMLDQIEGNGQERDRLDTYFASMKKLLARLQSGSKAAVLIAELASRHYSDFVAIDVHRKALEVLAQNGWVPSRKKIEKVLVDIQGYFRTPLIYHLAKRWTLYNQSTKNMARYRIENIPNKAFTLELDSGKQVKVLRMGSPGTSSGSIDLRYLSFIELSSRRGRRHMDLSLVRQSGKVTDVTAGEARFRLQTGFAETLLAWASDPYSDFAMQSQDDDLLEWKRADEFINQLADRILDPEHKVFRIPESFIESSRFEKEVHLLLKAVHQEVFHSALKLNTQERCDFITLSTIYLLEWFIADFNPQTLATACRKHIDRGMVATTLLYVYSLIKGGTIHQPLAIEPLEMLIFSPSLLFSQRPTHLERMNRLLSSMSRLMDPKAIVKIRSRRTVLSDVKILF